MSGAATRVVDNGGVVAVSSTVEVDPANPVFTGHYPGCPILPGLYLIEYVHETVSATDRFGGARLVAVDRARYAHPVRPGDVLRIEARLAEENGQLACAATVFTQLRQVATIRLRYRMPGAGGQR